MYLYLATFVGTGASRDPFRAPGMMPGASLLDFRGDCSKVEGFSILSSPAPVNDPRVRLIAEDPREVIAKTTRTLLNNYLNVSIGGWVPLADALLGILASPPSKHAWRKLETCPVFKPHMRGANPRRYELWMGNQLVSAAPLITGGASFSDDFARADTVNTLGANWTVLKGDGYTITDQEVRANQNTDKDRIWKWATSCDTANHFSEFRIVPREEFSSDMGPCTRMAGSLNLPDCYYVSAWHNDPHMGKFVSNTQSLVASISPYPAEFTWTRLVSNGSTHSVHIGPRGAQAQLYSGTDTTLPSNLGVGAFQYAENSAWDDWYGGDGDGAIGPITPDAGPFAQSKMVRQASGGNFDITYNAGVISGNSAIVVLATGPTTITAAHISTLVGSTGSWVRDVVQNNDTNNNIAILRAAITGSGTLTVRINVPSSTTYQACVIETDPLIASPLTGTLSATAVNRNVDTGTGNNTASDTGFSLTAMSHDGSGSTRIQLYQPPWTKLQEEESTAGFPLSVGWKHSASGDSLQGRFTHLGDVRYYVVSANYELDPDPPDPPAGRPGNKRGLMGIY
jgi:hypothetical protein